MGRRYVYAVAAGAALSLLVCPSGISQPQVQVQQPDGPKAPVQVPGDAVQMPVNGGAPGSLGSRDARPDSSNHKLLRATDPSQAAGDASDRWRKMSPDDRQRLRSNAERWQNMDAEERRTFREQREWRQMRLKRDAEAAMRDSGLHLEAERRALFEQRYIEERRRIDQQLRRELREKRRRELAPIVEQLKKELGEKQSRGYGGDLGSSSPAPQK